MFVITSNTPTPPPRIPNFIHSPLVEAEIFSCSPLAASPRLLPVLIYPQPCSKGNNLPWDRRQWKEREHGSCRSEHSRQSNEHVLKVWGVLDHFVIEPLGVRWTWRVYYFADVRSVDRPRPDINVSGYLIFLSLACSDKVWKVLARSRASAVAIALGVLESRINTLHPIKRCLDMLVANEEPVSDIVVILPARYWARNVSAPLQSAVFSPGNSRGLGFSPA